MKIHDVINRLGTRAGVRRFGLAALVLTMASALAPVAEATEVTFYSEDFEGPGGQGDTGGWTPIDRTEQAGTFWHFVRERDPKLDQDERAVMWCGSEDACWANPRGYGNGWKQNLDKRFVLPPGPVRMAAEYAWDTGPDFDYFEVLISKDGGATYDELAIHDGSSGGYVKESFDLSTYAGQEVLIRFRLDSDGAYSDEDGLYLSDGGGARIRYVEITGHRRDQFKTGSNGWTASVDPPTGGGPFRLEDDPPVDPALLGQCDPQCAPVEERGHSWVAYNPATGLIDRGVNLGIQSPPIRLPAGADQILLEFDMYWDQAPFAETRIVWGWEDSAGDAFPCLHFLHAFQWYTTGSSNGWLRVRVDMTSFIEPGATSVVVNLKAGDWVTLVGTTPGIRLGSGPYYDNVRLIAVTAN